MHRLIYFRRYLTQLGVEFGYNNDSRFTMRIPPGNGRPEMILPVSGQISHLLLTRYLNGYLTSPDTLEVDRLLRERFPALYPAALQRAATLGGGVWQ